jgi:hypothetical protein
VFSGSGPEAWLRVSCSCRDCGCADTQILESANDTNDLYDTSRSSICFIMTVSHIDCATPSVRSPLKQQHCSNTFSPLGPSIALLSARLRPSAPFCSLAPMNPPLPLANSPLPLPLPLCLAQDSCAYNRCSFLFRSALRSCLLKVLIAHHLRLP